MNTNTVQMTEIATAFLSHILNRRNNERITKRKSVEMILIEKGVRVNRHGIILMFKNFMGNDFGKYIPGRRGQPTRFEWTKNALEIATSLLSDTATSSVDLISLDKNILPDVSKPNEITDTENKRPSIIHKFVLRKSTTIEFELPSDFSAMEAGRLARFIETLPFN